jgi:hypothetical protein
MKCIPNRSWNSHIFIVERLRTRARFNVLWINQGICLVMLEKFTIFTAEHFRICPAFCLNALRVVSIYHLECGEVRFNLECCDLCGAIEESPCKMLENSRTFVFRMRSVISVNLYNNKVVFL